MAAAAIARCFTAALVAAAATERDAAMATVVEAEAQSFEARANNTALLSPELDRVKRWAASMKSLKG